MYQTVHEDGSVLLQHDNQLEEDTLLTGKINLQFNELLVEFQQHGKAVKVDFKDKNNVLSESIKLLKKHGFNNQNICLNGNIDVVKEDWFKMLSAAFPNAVIQTSVDLICPLVFSLPDQAKNMLTQLKGWGINRFSMNWSMKKCSALMSQLKNMGI